MKRRLPWACSVAAVMVFISNSVLVSVFADTGMSGGDPAEDAAIAAILAIIIILLILRQANKPGANLARGALADLANRLLQKVPETYFDQPAQPPPQKTKKPCPECNGSKVKSITCDKCNGTGAAISRKDSQEYSCDPCKGTGKLTIACPTCKGTGEILVP